MKFHVDRWWGKAVRQARERRKAVVLLQLAFAERHAPAEAFPYLRWIVMSSGTYRSLYGVLTGTAKSSDFSRQTGWTLIVERRQAKTWSFDQANPPIMTRTGHFGVRFEGGHDLRFVPESEVTPDVVREIEKRFDERV